MRVGKVVTLQGGLQYVFAQVKTFVQLHVHRVPVAQAVVGIIGNQGKALSCIEKRGAEAVRPIPQIDDG